MSSQPPYVLQQETAFEKGRGVSRVEIQDGFAQIDVSELPEPTGPARLEVLRAVAEAGISVDFVKLAPAGVTFLVEEAKAPETESVLSYLNVKACVTHQQSIVLVHAVNMRDEEGLLAKVVSLAIGTSAPIDHLADMHDQLLIVTNHQGARTIADAVTADRGESQ